MYVLAISFLFVLASARTTTPQPDACDPQPCQNGGTCIDIGYGSYFCYCGNGAFVGDDCEIVVDECDPNPCKNDGVCKDTPGSLRTYYCECPFGTKGDICQFNWGKSLCEGIFCSNGGQCGPGPNNDYKCNCLNGYTGRHCDTRILDPDNPPTPPAPTTPTTTVATTTTPAPTTTVAPTTTPAPTTTTEATTTTAKPTTTEATTTTPKPTTTEATTTTPKPTTTPTTTVTTTPTTIPTTTRELQ